MSASWSKTTLLMWLTLIIALLLSVAPMPEHLEAGRPLWLALVLTFWAMNYPHQVGLLTAWSLGIAQDILYGSLFGQHALSLMLVVFLILTLQQRLKTLGAGRPELEVQLRADQAAPYGAVAQLIGWCQAAGLHRMAFVTDADTATAPTLTPTPLPKQP